MVLSLSLLDESLNISSLDGFSSHFETSPQKIACKPSSINIESPPKILSSDRLPVNFGIPSETSGSKRSSSNLVAPPVAVEYQQPSTSSEKESAIVLHRLSSSPAAEAVESPAILGDADAEFMRQMGYTQELKRGFSGLMSFTFCFTVVSVFPSLSIGLDFGLNTGGSGIIFWGWIVGSFFNILVGLSLSEICSTYPNAGSVYYWTGQLAPIQYAPLASYICGWANFFGNVGGVAAYASGLASILNAAVALDTHTGNNTFGLNDVPNTISLNSRILTGIAIGVVILWAIQNCLKINQQGWLNNLAAFIQMASTISIIISILVLAKKRASAYDVFISTYNGTGFSFPYVCLIGILPTLFSFSGFEAAGHLTEETHKADRKAPLAISGTCISAACVGLAYILSLLFASGDPQYVAQNSLNPSATVQIFQTNASYPVALLFTILLIICLYFAGVSSTTVSSRTCYALGRDSLFPCNKYLCIVDKRTQTPLVCVLVVAVINILLLLLQLFSTTAFAAIIAISTIGFQVSYMIPIFFRITSSRKTFKLGKFNLGKFGLAIGWLSTFWLFITSIVLLFPFHYPVTAQNMNWTIVVCTGIAIFAALYWIFSLRTWFTGPPRMANDIGEAPPLDHVTTQ